MNNETLFLAQSSPMGMMNIFFIVAMIAVFYFFMIRPQNKKRKQLEQMRKDLKKGDHVLTIGGIHGKVAEVKETTIILQVEGGVKIIVEKYRDVVFLEDTSNRFKFLKGTQFWIK